MALTTVVIVVLRYGFSIGAIGAQESVLYMHSALFMLGAAWALQRDEHVRVDIFYRRMGVRGKAWVNALGHVLFTLPFCAVVLATSVDYVADAWRIREGSPEPGGLPAVFLLKTLIPLMALLLALQALAEILKALAALGEDAARG